MSLARVVLHVGPPRTGTTAIQGALAACRRQLVDHRIYHPPTQPESTEGQPSLAWDVLTECGRSVPRLSEAYVSWDEALLGAERAGAQTLLISSEDFCSEAFDGEAFLQLRRHLGSLPVEVVFALRDPRRLVPSIWSQSVKWGIGCGEEKLSLREAAPLILSRPTVRVVDYLSTLEEFLQPVRVNFLTVPRKRNRALLLKRFSEACGLPIAEILETADSRDNTPQHNAALPLSHLLILLSINQAMGDRDTVCQSLTNFLEVRRRLLDLLPQMGAVASIKSAVLPLDFHSAAEDLARTIVQWVEARGARVSGDLRDVLDENNAIHNQSEPAPTEAEINKAAPACLEEAVFYLTETAFDLTNTITEVEKARDFWYEQACNWERVYLSTVTEIENARDFWHEQACNWERVCLKLTSSWSWKLTKPLRHTGPLLSLFKLLQARNG